MNKQIAILLIAFLPLASFKPAEDFCKRQGIKGYVRLAKGNQMPSPDVQRAEPAGIQTSLYVYELTNTSQVITQGAFYESISTKLIKEIRTDENGYFKTKLKPGTYSLFVKKGDLFYSNIFDEKNNIHPVVVKKGDWTEVNFRADYDAVY